MIILALAPLALQDQHAIFHPQNAAIFVQVPDIQALADAYPRTGLWRMVADEEVHAALGPAVGGESFDLQAELDAFLQQGLEQAGLPPLDETGVLDLTALSFSLVLPIEELAAGGDFQTILMEKASATLALEFTDEDAGSAFGESLEKMGLGQDPAQPVSLWRDTRYVVLLAGKPARSDFERRLVEELPSFAARVQNDGATKHFTPAAGVTVIEGYSALGEISKATGKVPFLAEAGPLMGLLKGTFSGNLGVLLSGGHFRMQLRDGRFVTESFRAEAAPAPETEGEDETASTDALALLDPQAMVGGVAHVDPAALFSALVPVSDKLLQVTAGGAMAGIEDTYGFHVQNDLFDPLGHSVAFSLGPITGPTAPDFRVVCALKDRERFQVGMAGLCRVVADLAGEQVEIKESAYRKVPMYTFSWRSEGSSDTGLPFDLAGLFKPTIAVLEDRVLFTLNSRYAKDEVRRLEESSTNGGTAVAAGIELARSRVPPEAFEAGFSDWIGMVARLYTTLKNLAPMAAGLGMELPFDPEQLPEADVFTRFFQPGYHWQKRVPGGVLSYAESSLGPEAPLLFFGGLAAGAIAAQTGAMPWDQGGSVQVRPATPASPPAPQPTGSTNGSNAGAEEATREALSQLAVGIAVYQIDQGAFPGELAVLERATSAFPDGFLGGAKVPQDGWGRAFRYELAAESYRLWSVGPDGNDQAGASDDILAR